MRREPAERIRATRGIALREVDAVAARVLRANDAEEGHLLAFERHLDVDHAADLERGERAALERDEQAFGADVADDGRQLAARKHDARVDARVRPHGHAERQPLFLPERSFLRHDVPPSSAATFCR